jgi:alpha-glucoside transport system substrate-binding protein
MRGKTLITVTAVGATAMLSSACLSTSSSSSSSAPVGSASGGSASAQTGGTVTIWSSVDQDVQDGLYADVKAKAAAAGITVNWKKVEGIDKLIITKLDGGDVPDIALVPQPGVVAQIVKKGKAQPLDTVLDMTALKSSMVPGTIESGQVDGKLYGLLSSMNVKSLVFYPKKAWDAKGYTAPKTFDELVALGDKIKADGTATSPWCMAIGSGGGATGWPATDWIEDLVMRDGGAAQYNDWVAGKVKFDSPLVREAAGQFAKIALTPGNVAGGAKAIVATDFGKAPLPMFDAKPGCFLLKQGSFITGFFPKSVTADLDNQAGVFGFPPTKAGGENPVLGGGDLAVLLSTNPAAAQTMKFLADATTGVSAAKNGSSYLSPHKDFDATLYKGAMKQSIAKVAYDSSAFLFDGSDAMPQKVGQGTFWKDMTAWVSGSETLDQALKNIDASWPAS